MSYTAIVCAQILYSSDLPSLHEVYSQLQRSTLFDMITSPGERSALIALCNSPSSSQGAK